MEVENVGSAVKYNRTSTKQGAVVVSALSVMTPAVQAFDSLPEDVQTMGVHTLYRPGVPTQGQAMATVPFRISPDVYQQMKVLVDIFGCKIIPLGSYEEHDNKTADTQATAHFKAISRGTAWKYCGFFPWQNTAYIGGIGNMKASSTIRVLSGKPHVSGGIMMLNPRAKDQIDAYTTAVFDLFTLMITGQEAKFRETVDEAIEYVFRQRQKNPLLLDDKVMGEYSLGNIPANERTPNSELSNLAEPVMYFRLKKNPFETQLCGTPISRIELGKMEYICRTPELKEEAFQAAFNDLTIREHDLQFVRAVLEWNTLVQNGDSEGFKQKFKETKAFFSDEQIAEANRVATDIIKRFGYAPLF
ncbi:prephenate dehydrogenase [Candidatus Woesearchaeota archaeon]|nr:prephenate dehydrogenase [Candidatus Woesearchaeota archaeon]